MDLNEFWQLLTNPEHMMVELTYFFLLDIILVPIITLVMFKLRDRWHGHTTKKG